MKNIGKMEEKVDVERESEKVSEGGIEKIGEKDKESVETRLKEVDSALKLYEQDKPRYILLEKTKALYTRLHPYLLLFPKSEKFTLGQKIEEGVLKCIRLLVLQNYQQTDKERKDMMLKFISEISVLEVLIYQAVVFRYISYPNYGKIKPFVNEINRFALSRYKNLNSLGQNEK